MKEKGWRQKYWGFFLFASSAIDLERFLHWPRAFSLLTRARVSLEHTWAEKHTKKLSATQAICCV